MRGGPKIERNILKCVGPRRDWYFLGFIYFVLTYVYVFTLMLWSENMYGTRPC